jgi:hypothetical protein
MLYLPVWSSTIYFDHNEHTCSLTGLFLQIRIYMHALLSVNAKYLSEDEEVFSRRGALKLILMEQEVCCDT